MLVSLLTQVAFAESTNITSEADFFSALESAETTEMNITGNVSVDASIEKRIDINVKSGATLTLNFDEGDLEYYKKEGNINRKLRLQY